MQQALSACIDAGSVAQTLALWHRRWPSGRSGTQSLQKDSRLPDVAVSAVSRSPACLGCGVALFCVGMQWLPTTHNTSARCVRTAVLRRVQVLDVRSPIALCHEAKVGEAGTSGDSSEPEPMRL